MKSTSRVRRREKRTREASSVAIDRAASPTLLYVYRDIINVEICRIFSAGVSNKGELYRLSLIAANVEVEVLPATRLAPIAQGLQRLQRMSTRIEHTHIEIVVRMLRLLSCNVPVKAKLC